VSDQQAGEERGEIEKRDPRRRDLNGDSGASRRYGLLNVRRQRGDRYDSARHIGARLGGRAGVSRCRDRRSSGSKSLLTGRTRVAWPRMTDGGFGRTPSRSSSTQLPQPEPAPKPTKTCHDILHRSADARQNTQRNRPKFRSPPSPMPENRRDRCGKSRARPITAPRAATIERSPRR